MIAALKKKPTIALTVGAAALLVGGGAAAYWFFSQRGVGVGEMPVGANVIPQDALMALTFTTDLAQWRQLRSFGTSQSQSAVDQNLAQLRDRLLTTNGLDFERDVRPWVGKEITTALLASQPAPPASNSTAPTAVPPSMLMILPIQDPMQAKQTLEKPRAETGQLSSRKYKDVDIKEKIGATPADSFSIAALDGKLLVVTNDAKAIDQAIDTYKGGAALSSTPGYAQALSKVKTQNPFGRLYLNFAAASAFTAANLGKAPQSAESQQTQGVAVTADLAPEGIQLKGISWLKPNSQRKLEVRNTAHSMPSRLPTDTVLMVSGGSLKRLWRDYNQGMSVPINPRVLPPPDILKTAIKSTVGMDLEKDLLEWMDGEFAVALVGAPPGSPPGFPVGLVVMSQVSDRRAAETAIQRLNDAMANKYKYKVEDSKVANQPVTQWSLAATAGPAITHGWLDGDVVFINLAAPLAPSLLPRPAAPLSESEPFKKFVPTTPNPNNGNFFVNLESLSNKKIPLLQLPPGNRDLLSAIRTIGITAAVSDERSSRYDVFVALKSGNPAGPLPSPGPTGLAPASPTPSPSP